MLIQAIAQSIQYYLDEHDKLDPRHKHQAMVLTHTIDSATKFVEIYNRVCNPINDPNDRCEKYTSVPRANVPAVNAPLVVARNILASFVNGEIRVLVVAGKLLEGFDRKNVSVAGIVRNVRPESKVLFTQFVGRAVRKLDQYDPVTAIVVSHRFYNQHGNYDHFDKITDIDNIDEED